MRPAALALLLAGMLAGCLQQNPLGDAPGNDGIALIPATLFLEPGSSVTLSPSAELVAGGPLQWVSSAVQVATVGSDGQVTAQGIGIAEIVARNSRGSARTRVTVVAPVAPVVSWQIERQGLTDVSLLGAWSASEQTSFAVGQRGTILRTDDAGATWVRLATPDTTDLVSIWGFSAGDVYAVGGGGTILHYDGQSWSRMQSPVGNQLLEIFGFAPDDLYAVGAGVAVHFDGNTWQLLSGVENAELWAVWGTDRANLFAAGQNGVIYRLQGSHWTRLASPTDLLLLGIWGTAPDNIYAVGIQGTVLKWDGLSWTPVPVPLRNNLFAIWGKGGGEILAVGDHGAMLLFNGVAWTLVPQDATGENLRAVHAAPQGSFVVAGWAGTTLQRRTTGSWRLGTAAPLLFDVATGPGNRRVAVGANGAVLREGAGASWSPLPVERRQTLYGARSVQDQLVVVGDSGTILRYDGQGWQDESFATSRLLRSIWLDQTGQGFIVGERGMMLRRQGGRWVETTPVTGAFLRHVFGFSASDLYAVGDSGTVVQWNGVAWRRMRTPNDSLLRGVWGSAPDDLFAVGVGGVTLRFDGTRWYELPSPTRKDLRAVWGTGPTDVYAAGEDGVLLRFNGARWTSMPSPTQALLLGFERREGGAPTVVGGLGTVLRGER